ncbi:MAG: PP2C family protein-serine/threonine phosphatase [Thiomonas sp.]
MKFSVYQVSRRGARTTNQDRMGYCYTRESALFALADGLGGHPRGEVAAHLALQTIATLFQREARPALRDPQEFLRRSIFRAHEQIQRYAQEQRLSDSPRTTVVACVLQNGAAHWAHVGDSRLYFIRNGAMLTRTRDHSHVEQQHRKDEMHGLALLQPDGPTRNMLFTCLGSTQLPMIEVGLPQAMRRGDIILLCSDGLWGQIPESVLVRQFSQQVLSDAVPEVVEMALRQGGADSDNVTALGVEWEADPDELETALRIETESMQQGAFKSTIQSELVDQQVEEMDDAAIERSIAEINAAIRQSAGRK